jgi:hypothetical protein
MHLHFATSVAFSAMASPTILVGSTMGRSPHEPSLALRLRPPVEPRGHKCEATHCLRQAHPPTHRRAARCQFANEEGRARPRADVAADHARSTCGTTGPQCRDRTGSAVKGGREPHFRPCPDPRVSPVNLRGVCGVASGRGDAIATYCTGGRAPRVCAVEGCASKRARSSRAFRAGNANRETSMPSVAGGGP